MHSHGGQGRINHSGISEIQTLPIHGRNYFIGYASDPELGAERISYARLIDTENETRIVGGRFNFGNFEFLLMLLKGDFSRLQIGEREVFSIRHPHRLNFASGQFLALSW